jgi:hypothetical protein
MAYCPPSSSKWAPAEPFRKNRPDADGWQTVPSKATLATVGITASTTANTKTPNKWGGSALKKPAPKFEDEFPTLGGAKPAAAPAPTTTTTPSAPMTMAERMKAKLAEEEAERLRLAEEARIKAEEEEKNRFTENVIPLTSFIRASIARKFNVDNEYHDPETAYAAEADAEYYNEYPDHYHEDHCAPHEYDDGYDDHGEYTGDNYDHNHTAEGDFYGRRY